jgi:general secretion pathway protein J
MCGAAIKEREDGFTLLELLVALLVFAVLSVMAYGGLRQVSSVEQRSEFESKRLNELEFAFLLVGRDLAQAVDRSVRDQLGTSKPAFAGGQGHQSLLEMTTFLGDDGRLGRIEYTLNGESLRRVRWPVLDTMPQTRPDNTEILGGVTKLQVRFLDKEWQQTWPAPSSAAALPRAVELTLQLHDGTEFHRLFTLPNA